MRKRGVLLLLFLIAIGIFSFIIIYSSTFNSVGFISGYHLVNLTDSEKCWITNHPIIRVCPDSNFPPFEMISENGQYEGISADLLREIGKKTGFTLEVVPEPEWNGCIERIQNGSIDILGAIYISQLRQEYLLYSDPYYQTFLPIITRNSTLHGLTLDHFSGKRVASVRGYTTTLLLFQDYPEINVVEVPNIKDGLECVSLGRVDAFFGDLATSSWYVDKEGYSNLHVSGSYLPQNVDDFSYAFGVRKDYPELVGILNKGLHAIQDDEKESIFRTWISPTLSQPVLNPVYTYVIAGVVGFLFLISLLSFFWNRTLKKIVEIKTRALSQELAEHRKTSHMLMMTRHAVDHSRALILWLDEEGIIRDINETTVRISGLQRKDILGKNLSIFQTKYTPEQIKQYLPNIQEQEYFQTELFLKLQDGGDIPVEVFIWYFTFEGTGVYCLEILDISERYENEKQIRENEEKYRDLFQNVNDAIFLFAIDEGNHPGMILEANGIAEKMTGFSRDELCTSLYSSLGKDPSGTMCLDIPECISGRCNRIWEVITKSAKVIPVEENLHVFERNGMLFGLALLRDITERRIYEEERAVAIEQIHKNMAELSVLNDGIRNPLTVILAITETECPMVFQVIENQVNLIDKTINQLDQRWNESEKILSYLKKHYGIHITRKK